MIACAVVLRSFTNFCQNKRRRQVREAMRYSNLRGKKLPMQRESQALIDTAETVLLPCIGFKRSSGGCLPAGGGDGESQSQSKQSLSQCLPRMIPISKRRLSSPYFKAGCKRQTCKIKNFSRKIKSSINKVWLIKKRNDFSWSPKCEMKQGKNSWNISARWKRYKVFMIKSGKILIDRAVSLSRVDLWTNILVINKIQ